METQAHQQARLQYESIAQMVRALDCDYDRIEEVQDELTDLRRRRDEHYEEQRDAVNVYAAAVARREHQSLLAQIAELDDELSALLSDKGEYESREDAEQAIYDSPLSAEYRSGWETNPSDMTPAEVLVVLCTGGPHVEIVADYEDGSCSRPRILFRDWGERGEFFDFEREVVERYLEILIPA